MAVVGRENIFPKESTLNLRLLKFFCDFSLVLDGELPESVTSYISYMKLHYHFEKDVFPYLEVELTLPKSICLKIQNNSDSALFLLNLTKQDISENIPETSYERYYENVLLKPVNIPHLTLEAEDELETDSIVDDIPQHKLKMFMFKKDHLYFNKKLNHQVYNDCTVSDVLLDLIGKNFESSEMDFNIGKIVNDKVYDQIIIPPINFIDSIKYLQRVYGLFNNGLNLFFDFTSVFISDKIKLVESGNPDFIKDAYIELYSQKDNERTGINTMNVSFFNEENNSFVVRTTSEGIMPNISGSKKEIDGEAITILSTSNESSDVRNCLNMTFDSGSNDARRPKEKLYWNPYTNELNESEFKSKSSLDFKVLQLNIKEADLEIFSINRRYIIVDKNDSFDQDRSGFYKVVDMEFLLTGNNDDCFKVSCNLRLKRILNEE